MEPVGKATITCETTGDFCEYDCKKRGQWSTKDADLNFVSGVVKNKEGVAKYMVSGKYTEKLEVTDLATQESWVTF